MLWRPFWRKKPEPVVVDEKLAKFFEESPKIPPPPPETEEEKTVRLEAERVRLEAKLAQEEARKEQKRKDRLREGFEERLTRLFEKIDYEVSDDPYGQLGREDAGKDAQEIVDACNSIYEMGARLKVVPFADSPVFETSDVIDLSALLFLGLRQDVNRLLYDKLQAKGVPEEMLETVWDDYGTYEGDAVYGEYDSDEE